MKLTSLTSSYFKFPLGVEVKNRHGEKGYIELCGIDFRGEIYLVSFPDHESKYHVTEELTLVIQPMYTEDQEDPHCIRPKTDILED